MRIKRCPRCGQAGRLTIKRIRGRRYFVIKHPGTVHGLGNFESDEVFKIVCSLIREYAY